MLLRGKADRIDLLILKRLRKKYLQWQAHYYVSMQLKNFLIRDICGVFHNGISNFHLSVSKNW